MMPLPRAFDVLDALLRDMERWPDATKYLPMDSAVDSPTGIDAILALRAVLKAKEGGALLWLNLSPDKWVRVDNSLSDAQLDQLARMIKANALQELSSINGEFVTQGKTLDAIARLIVAAGLEPACDEIAQRAAGTYQGIRACNADR